MRLSGLAVLPLLFSGCAERPFKYVAPDFGAHVPAQVALLPFDNETVNLAGPEEVRKLVAQRLSGYGYSALGLQQVDDKLHEIGITDGGQLKAYSTQDLGRKLGVQGLFYGSLEEFVVQNVGFVVRRAVRLRLKLVDASSGERLWEATGSGTNSVVVTNKKDAERMFVVGVAQRGAENALRMPLLSESRLAVEKLLGSLPRR